MKFANELGGHDFPPRQNANPEKCAASSSVALDSDAACEALETLFVPQGPKRDKETQQSIPPPPNMRNAVARRAIKRLRRFRGTADMERCSVRNDL